MNSNHLNPETIIRALDLRPLPDEGGLFRQTYKSPEQIPGAHLPERYAQQDKPFSTAIFYLLTDDSDSFSALHRLRTDEVYHFYLGDPLEVLLLYPDGSSRHITLGQDILAGQLLQFVVPRGVWQGSRVTQGGQYALIGTTMTPGYTQDDFELGKRADLLAQYPDEQEHILALTREG